MNFKLKSKIPIIQELDFHINGRVLKSKIDYQFMLATDNKSKIYRCSVNIRVSSPHEFNLQMQKIVSNILFDLQSLSKVQNHNFIENIASYYHKIRQEYENHQPGYFLKNDLELSQDQKDYSLIVMTDLASLYIDFIDTSVNNPIIYFVGNCDYEEEHGIAIKLDTKLNIHEVHGQ